MAVDYFLKLDGIKGESTDDKHKDEIEIESFSWGLTQSGTFASGGGGGAGKVQFQDFHFNGGISSASPQLFLKCATGAHLKSALLTGVREGIKGENSEFLKVELTDVLISSYQTAGSAGSDSLPTEQVSLNFAKIVYTVASQNKDGSAGGAISGGWDLKANKKV